MTSAQGPGVKKCANIGISDLGDTRGFDAPGVDGKTYALQLKNNIYKRVEVTSGGALDDIVDTTRATVNTKYALVNTGNNWIIYPSFGGKLFDLDDVESTTVARNKPYMLVFTEDDKWVLLPDNDWLLNIRLGSPYVFTDNKDNHLNKVVNNGTLLVAYVPTQRRSVVISPLDSMAAHMLSSKPAIQNVTLQLVSEFEGVVRILESLPANSTLIIKVHLGEPSGNDVEIVKGIKLGWGKRHQYQVCNVYVRMGVGSNTSLQGVNVIVENKISLTKIFLPDNIHFMGMKFTPELLSENQLEIIS